jgi:hypothetical protein
MGGLNMGIKLTKTGLTIVGILVLFLIIAVALVTNAASPTPKPKASPTPTATTQPTITIPTSIPFTVASAVGVQSITITCQNTGSTITLTSVDLPKTISVKYDNTLTLKVTASSGYRFNYWQFGDNSVDSHNPYTIKLTAPLQMEARFLMDTTTG